MDIEEAVLEDLAKLTGEKKMSPAVSKAVTEFVKRGKAKEFGRMLREGVFDYELTNEDLERQNP